MKNESNGYDEVKNAAVLLFKLCQHVTGLDSEATTPHYQLVLRILGSHSAHHVERDEFEITEKIKKQMVKNGRHTDAVYFSELCRKLETDDVLKNRWAILCFLMNFDGSKRSPVHKSAAFSRSLAVFANSENNPAHTNLNQIAMGGSCPSTIRSTLSSRSRSSAKDASNNLDTLPLLHNLPSSNSGSNVISVQPQKSVSSRVARVAAMFSHRDLEEDQTPLLSHKSQRDRDSLSSPTSRQDSLKIRKEISECQLLREVVYVFQGIEGEVIKFEVDRNSFLIDDSISISNSTKKILLRLAELGWLYRNVKKYCDQRSTDRALGLVGQSFIAALQQELTEYYRLLAVLEAQLHSQELNQSSTKSGSSLTLRRLVVWTMDPLVRLKALSTLVDASKGLKGGALVSTIYSYLQHGDPMIIDLITNLLSQVVQPLYIMLNCWIYDGELQDNFNEFFVDSNSNVLDEKLWHEKYRLRKSMVPAFISIEQARKILLTGKNINFIRQVCQDHSSYCGRDTITAVIDDLSVESLFMQDTNGDFQALIDMAYEQTSNHVLDLMQTQYKFLEHMQGLRRYLLLGQGDFIRHLMDLLEPELVKPIDTLYLHNLSSILEMAIRATNAQYEDPEILKRLDVRLLEVSPGDSGWDVFSLDYHVDGPIGTIFTPRCMLLYLRLFNALWRSKRMEYILSSMWREQMSYSRLLKEIPELVPAMYQCYILSSEMVHFVQQIQYYITFEVMECSWDVLVKNVKSAKDLDDVIAAHEQFLETVLARALLDEDSESLLTQLRTIYDVIIQFESVQNKLWTEAYQELETRSETQDQRNANTAKGKWGATEAEDKQEKKRQLVFIKKTIPTARSQLRILATSYQDMVRNFLIMLAQHQDVNLQFLSFRLDFNEHYKNRDSSLRTSFTYQHRRKSMQFSKSKSSQQLL